MSPSMPAKPRIPFQPNPFGGSALGSPWNGELADVPSIHQGPFRTILDALRQVRAGGKGTSVVLIGEPGSGKTHLLARLRNQLRRDQHSGSGITIYVYLRCNASSSTLWRHLRRALASDLLKGTEGSQLQAAFAAGRRIDGVTHIGVRRALECLREGRHVHAATAWLQGDVLGETDLTSLGLAQDTEDEDHTREWEAQMVVDALLQYLAPTPVVLCFDQVEALETYRGEEAGYHAMGQMISALIDGHEHLLLISCVVAAFENQIDRLANGADKDRWLRRKDVLRPIAWDQAVALIRSRLDAAAGLKALRASHSDDVLWPIDATALRPLFAATDLCLPRVLIRACEQQFRELMGDAEPLPQKNHEQFLEEEFDARLKDAARTVAKQGFGKTFSDSLPWLLQSSGFLPLSKASMRGTSPSQAWRSPHGDIALAFCDGRGNTLTNHFKRLDRDWPGAASQLAILRDIGIQPGAAGARVLAGLKQRGAREVHPMPEALAALQAIRDLIASARSAELWNGDQLVSETEVTAWALGNLPAQLSELRDSLAASQAQVEDPLLARLAALLNERKILATDAAANELSLSAEEVSRCARRYPLRFGLLDGPPLVIFEAAGRAAG